MKKQKEKRFMIRCEVCNYNESTNNEVDAFKVAQEHKAGTHGSRIVLEAKK